MSEFTVATLDRIPARDGWIPVRDHLGIGAFGINAYRSGQVGGTLIGDHTETLAKHEELYLVVDGHATFTVAGDEIDAPAGTLVLVADAATRRSAVAKAAGTTVLVAGARPGHAFQVSSWEQAWEPSQEAMKLYREQRYGDAADVLREAVTRQPGAAGLLYNLACFDSMAGADVAAVTQPLARAVALDPGFADFARDDPDFAPVRDDPAFQAVVGVPADDGGAADVSGPPQRVERLDDIDEVTDGRCPWRAVGLHLGVTSFGVNSWTAAGAGDRLINEHDESDADSPEELYFVQRGHATFELGGERVDAPAGTLVFALPAVKRTAFADEPGTTVVAFGGVRGAAYRPDGWQLWAPLNPLYAEGNYDEAVDRGRELVREHPGYPLPLYNLACCESLAGHTGDAVTHLRQAIDLSDQLRAFAEEDSDLDAIRDDPAFKQLVGAEAAG